MKISFSILTTFIFITFFSCGLKTEEEVSPFEEYVIKAGEHDCGLGKKLVDDADLSYEVRFDETAEYTTDTPLNQLDINKLFGFSDCNGHHHTNSARFGWRWLDGNLEIHTYTYNNKVRSTEFLCNVELNKTYVFNINSTETSYILEVEGEATLEVDRKSDCSDGFRYKLWPYFGGDEVAPHDITIQMKTL